MMPKTKGPTETVKWKVASAWVNYDLLSRKLELEREFSLRGGQLNRLNRMLPENKTLTAKRYYDQKHEVIP